MEEKYKNRVTLITKFKEKDLEKIQKLRDKIPGETCKVPYIPDTEEERHRADTFPWHITIFIGNKNRVDEIIELTKKAKKKEITINFNDVIIQQSPKKKSWALLLTIEPNEDMINLQNLFYWKFTEETGRKGLYQGKDGEKYDASQYTFHMTFDIDMSEEKIRKEYEIIKENFKPFQVSFNNLLLYNDIGGSLIEDIEMGIENYGAQIEKESMMQIKENISKEK